MSVASSQKFYLITEREAWLLITVKRKEVKYYGCITETKNL